jgi:alkylation response protein AidB-like acyl-CoA dehydrogenase
MTLDYMKTRQQFGRAIGEFQVLQHRAVDMFVTLEQARVDVAASPPWRSASDDAAPRRQTMSAAKVQIGRLGALSSARRRSQLHGGIAMTDGVHASATTSSG